MLYDKKISCDYLIHWSQLKALTSVCVSMCVCKLVTRVRGGITCGAIDEPRKSSKAIDERVIINFRDKNVVIARFRDKNVAIARFCEQNEVFI